MPNSTLVIFSKFFNHPHRPLKEISIPLYEKHISKMVKISVKRSELELFNLPYTLFELF